MLILLFISVKWVCSSSSVFRISNDESGEFIEYPKDKHGEKQLGEDSFATTPQSLVVCDGVGSNDFSSKYLSYFLALIHQNRFLKKSVNSDQLVAGNTIDVITNKFNSVEEFKSFINDGINEAVNHYNQVIYQGLEIMGMEENLRETMPLFESSSTYVSASIVEIDNKEKLVFVNEGDSKGMLFKIINNNNDYHYEPVLMTQDNIIEFNMPQQVGTNAQNSLNDLVISVQNVNPTDIVLLGSDGVFDNIHTGFLAMTMNTIFLLSSSDRVSSKNVIEFLEKYVETYLVMIRGTGTSAHDHFFKKQNTKSEIDENNDESLDEFSNGSVHQIPKFKSEFIKDKQNDVNKLLNLSEKEYTSFSDIKKRIHKAFVTFLSCKVNEQLNLETNDEVNPIMSNCLTKIFNSGFNLNANEKQQALLNFDSKSASEIIAILSLRFSQQENYPSTFFIHAWKEGQYGFYKTGTGKRDDITAVVAMIDIKSTDSSINLVDYHNNLEMTLELWDLKLETDVSYFFNYVNAMISQSSSHRSNKIENESDDEFDLYKTSRRPLADIEEEEESEQFGMIDFKKTMRPRYDSRESNDRLSAFDDSNRDTEEEFDYSNFKQTIRPKNRAIDNEFDKEFNDDEDYFNQQIPTEFFNSDDFRKTHRPQDFILSRYEEDEENEDFQSLNQPNDRKYEDFHKYKEPLSSIPEDEDEEDKASTTNEFNQSQSNGIDTNQLFMTHRPKKDFSNYEESHVDDNDEEGEIKTPSKPKNYQLANDLKTLEGSGMKSKNHEQFQPIKN